MIEIHTNEHITIKNGNQPFRYFDKKFVKKNSTLLRGCLTGVVRT